MKNAAYICTLNVRSLSSVELKAALEDIKHDIIGLSEVRRLGEQIIKDDEYTFYYIGQIKRLYGQN